MTLKDTALILVDMQYDFLETGSLPIADATSVIPNVHKLATFFQQNNALIVATQDWHPANHSSFASQHPGKHPMDIVSLTYRDQTTDQMLWPEHCVGTRGAAIVDELFEFPSIVVQKGSNVFVDSYSGFADNMYHEITPLAKNLYQRGIKHVVVCGYATDICVKFTCLDAVKFGFDTTLIEDTTMPALPDSLTQTYSTLADRGVHLIPTVDAYIALIQ